jgi:hypothetical protein
MLPFEAWSLLAFLPSVVDEEVYSAMPPSAMKVHVDALLANNNTTSTQIMILSKKTTVIFCMPLWCGVVPIASASSSTSARPHHVEHTSPERKDE